MNDQNRTVRFDPTPAIAGGIMGSVKFVSDHHTIEPRQVEEVRGLSTGRIFAAAALCSATMMTNHDHMFGRRPVQVCKMDEDKPMTTFGRESKRKQRRKK